MTTTTRRRGSLLVALLTSFAFLLSLIAASPASAASPYMENKQRGFMSGPACLEIDQARGWNDAAAAVEWCDQRGMQMQWSASYVGYDGSGAYYQLRVAHSGKCLDVRGDANTDGAQVVQNSCSSSDWGQQWRFVHKSYANGMSYYEVVARHSQKCLDKSGWNVVQWNCHGGDWQQWSRPF